MYRLIAALLAGIVVGACAAPQTLVESIDVAALSSASTFAIDPPPPGTTGATTPQEGTRLRTAIEGEIARTLGRKGYRLTDPQSAELLVAYRLVYMGRVKRDEREDAVAQSRVAPGPGDPYGAYQALPESSQGERCRPGAPTVR